jgi:hypothetical protein
MRVLILATALLASSSLYPAFAQEGNKDQDTAPQTAPAQTNQNAPVQPDQSKADNREVGRDWRMHPDHDDRRSHMGRDDRMGGDDREMGRDWRMHRDREVDRDRDMDRGGYRERGDRADRDRGYRGYYDEDRLRRRVRICVEYENGDEYCRYRN